MSANWRVPNVMTQPGVKPPSVWAYALLLVLVCVFRTKVTGRFGIVTGDFGNVTVRSGDVTDRTGRQDWRCA